MAKLKDAVMPLVKPHADLGLDRPSSSLSLKSASCSMSSRVLSPQASNSDDQQNRLIKSLLKLLKKLELALDKFNHKLNGLTKTNILRTLLLPFLRLLMPLDDLFPTSSRIYQSLASVSTSILSQWWRQLLTALCLSGSQQVSATDRNAYLECLSRILARKEWHHADQQAAAAYTTCLADTMDFCISRLLLLKIMPISICAFVGKVFAFSFFYLPGTSDALLFLLNVKQKALDKQLPLFPPLNAEAKRTAQLAFPKHLRHLIDHRGIKNLEIFKRGAINSIYPPKHPVRGIRDPSGPWVRRWCSNNSDVFNSFFRHYISIADERTSAHPDTAPEAFPGFAVIATHIYQILFMSMNRILLAKPALPFNPSNRISQPLQNDKAAPETGRVATSFPYNQNDINYTTIIKLFKSIRDISFSQIPFSGSVTRIIDKLLANVAVSISLFDVHKVSLLLNLVYEFSMHVFDPANMDWEFWLGCNYLMLTNTHHIQIITKSFAFLFNVWEKVPSMLTKFDQPLEITFVRSWLTESNESFKTNFSNWLTSSRVWLLYFFHWNPLVRSYYLRLIVWRIIGVNNYASSCSIQTTRRVKRKIDFMHESMCEVLSSSTLSEPLSNLDFTADLPIVNRKFGVTPISNKSTFLGENHSLFFAASAARQSDLRKTHPYEIFDEAIYTCTSLPSTPNSLHSSDMTLGDPGNEAGHNSIISSLSKFFKKMSADETTEKDDFIMAPPKPIKLDRSEFGLLRKERPLSKSMTSLPSAPGMISRSSSPSLASFQSSTNELSADSSMTSDSDSSSFILDSLSSFTTQFPNLQPPELVKIPPDIIRPVYKLDIVLDHELAAYKCARMNDSKIKRNEVFFGSEHLANMSFSTLPKPPKLPSVSIYINSDVYNRIYVTKEDYEIEDDVFLENDVEDLTAFSQDFRRKLSCPTDMIALGKALNEWNNIVDEFESYLVDKVETDKIAYLSTMPTSSSNASTISAGEINEQEYLARIIPLLPIDNFTELKLLNAS